MEAVRSSAKSVNVYQTKWRHISEDGNFCGHRCVTQYHLRYLETRLLRGAFGHKTEKLTREWRTLHDEMGM
jgi:hypothetical protein